VLREITVPKVQLELKENKVLRVKLVPKENKDHKVL
jgi:hypothetical protein